MKIAIIGAGAAGCFAAANMGGDHEVHVFEKGPKAMQKVAVSGGGRCNVTHACFDIPELLRRYPRGSALLKRTLHRFGPAETIEWFAARGVAIKEEGDGRMFPVTDSSQTIIDAIWKGMTERGVRVHFGKGLRDAARIDNEWVLRLNTGETFSCDKILLAPGAILKPEGWAWLGDLGHTIVAPAPSLFTFNLREKALTTLMGVSVPDAVVRLAETKFVSEGPVLITHWGLSGPAVLRTSAYAARWLQEQSYNCTVLVAWLKDTREADLRQQFGTLRQQSGKGLVWSKNPFGLPRRLWEALAHRAGIGESMRWGELPASAQTKLITSLIADAYTMQGKTTFKEEFVTCGGIPVSEVNAQTCESRLAPGLFFAGEAMDVDGITGGYNFTHAWSSGWVAAQAICNMQ